MDMLDVKTFTYFLDLIALDMENEAKNGKETTINKLKEHRKLANDLYNASDEFQDLKDPIDRVLTMIKKLGLAIDLNTDTSFQKQIVFDSNEDTLYLIGFSKNFELLCLISSFYAWYILYFDLQDYKNLESKSTIVSLDDPQTANRLKDISMLSLFLILPDDENMLSLIKHFGSLVKENIKAGIITYEKDGSLSQNGIKILNNLIYAGTQIFLSDLSQKVLNIIAVSPKYISMRLFIAFRLEANLPYMELDRIIIGKNKESE